MRSAPFLIGLILVALLGGCAVSVGTDPDRFSLEPTATAHLRMPQNVALLNGYKEETKSQYGMPGGNTLVVENKALTETAVAMLGRALQKQGYTVSPQAQKTVTLRVVPRGYIYQAFRYTGRIMLEAKFGDGTEAFIPQENLGATWERGFDGAVLFALKDLLEHERFVAYVNK
jgi:hypothetical protein